MRSTVAGILAAFCVAGAAQAMGDRPPDGEARPGWERPGDVIGREGPLTPADAPPSADGPQIFFAPEGGPADWLWKARLVVVFADAPQNPNFLRQMRWLEEGVTQLIDRDAVVITDTDPAAASDWRRILRPEGFSVMLIEKDGAVMWRKPSPRDMREITATIDRFPLRRQEMRQGSVRP